MAAAPEPKPIVSIHDHTAIVARVRIRPTILYASFAAWWLVAAAAPASAQSDPFAAHRWHFEAETQAALEAWNYNGSHEELYGLHETLSYGVADGVVLRFGQHVVYVSQRGNDTWVLGLTFGARKRVYRRGGMSVFLQGELGISDAAIAAPPRGTRFNYIAMGGAGALIPLTPRVHFVGTLEVFHLSNASLKGPGRNPDIEAIGLSVGLNIGF